MIVAPLQPTSTDNRRTGDVCYPIVELTPSQQARFPEFVRKWIAIGLSTAPADRAKAERAIKGLYRLAKLQEPRIIWLPCPLSAALSAVCCTALALRRIGPQAEVGRPGADVTSRVVRSTIRAAVDNAIRAAVGSAVQTAVEAAVRSPVDAAVRRQVAWDVHSALYSAVDAAFRSAVHSSVLSTVSSTVGGAVAATIRAIALAVHTPLDWPIDAAMGAAAKAAIDATHRANVETAAEEALGSPIGFSAVDWALREAGLASYVGCSIWNTGQAAWADYFNEVCGVAIDRNLLEVTESCGFYWALNGVCFASERPSEINLDADGRLHCETGMSIRYAGTGWGLFHWHGTQIPDDWILERTSLTAQVALKTLSIEQRRAACDMLGWSKILQDLNAKVIDRDPDPQIGELVEVKLPDLTQPAKFLRVRCGTGREFTIGIPPEIVTALEAQAWMIGLNTKDFTRPEIRS